MGVRSSEHSEVHYSIMKLCMRKKHKKEMLELFEKFCDYQLFLLYDNDDHETAEVVVSAFEIVRNNVEL